VIAYRKIAYRNSIISFKKFNGSIQEIPTIAFIIVSLSR
jgi:hypothetical protein